MAAGEGATAHLEHLLLNIDVGHVMKREHPVAVGVADRGGRQRGG